MIDFGSLRQTAGYNIRPLRLRETRLVCLVAVILMNLGPAEAASQQGRNVAVGVTVAEDEFDWTQHRTSVADLSVGITLPFQHGKPELTQSEAEAYVELLNTIQERRFAAQKDTAGESRSIPALENAWESAFYSYEAARRLSWKNGKLQLRASSPAPSGASGTGSATGGNLSRAAISSSSQRVPYSLIGDMLNHPVDFVGRPVVLYGLYSPSGQVQLDTERRNIFDQRSTVRLQRGFLRNLVDSKDLAIVDAVGYIGPNNQLRPLGTWPAEQGTTVPVLVKGWFVKLWGQRPLIVTESVRILTPRPYDELIREYVRSGTRLSGDEKWLYYETLRQLQLTSGTAQSQLAGVLVRRRLDELMTEVQDKATADKLLLDRELRKELITEDEFRDRRLRLDRQLGMRLSRFRDYQQDTTRFPLFVDVFQHPDRWQGSTVSFSGHVRRVVSYTGDDEMFGGQPLHELWLYTDDSQHNPAVIITPSLPADFPVEADVIDRVTAAGCFFKLHVYRGESEHRIAPMILCGRISWSPTDDQIVALAAEGAMPSGSSLVIAARRRTTSQVSETAIMLFGFLAIVVMMAVWGRVQRDRRERKQLLELVDAQRHFDHTADVVRSPAIPDILPDRFRE